MSQVSVQPLLSQHHGEYGQQRDQKACVHEPGDGDDLARCILGLAGDSGLIEGEKDVAEESHVFVVLEVRMHIGDESCADDREQARLREQVR